MSPEREAEYRSWVANGGRGDIAQIAVRHALAETFTALDACRKERDRLAQVPVKWSEDAYRLGYDAATDALKAHVIAQVEALNSFEKENDTLKARVAELELTSKGAMSVEAMQARVAELERIESEQLDEINDLLAMMKVSEERRARLREAIRENLPGCAYSFSRCIHHQGSGAACMNSGLQQALDADAKEST